MFWIWTPKMGEPLLPATHPEHCVQSGGLAWASRPNEEPRFRILRRSDVRVNQFHRRQRKSKRSLFAQFLARLHGIFGHEIALVDVVSVSVTEPIINKIP